VKNDAAATDLVYPATKRVHGNAEKAEWVALMCLIANRDRDLYRELRAEAWDSVVRSGSCSKDSN